MKSLGKQTKTLDKSVSFLCGATIVGQKEGNGPLGKYFDVITEDAYHKQKNFENAEKQMQKDAVMHLLQKSGEKAGEIDVLMGGDLLNQCTASSYSARDLGIPYIGLYGACSTMAESLINGSILLDSGGANRVICGASSHFCTSERQYRQPLEHGNQRPPYSQWTVTGAGMALLGCEEKPPYITSVTIGKVVDLGITDPNNMGSAMAPAAADTLLAHFRETGRTPEYYDLIVTGDLGQMGKDILLDLMAREKMPLPRYDDCGVMIFDVEKQNTHAGGSGCGCSAVTLCGYLLKRLQGKDLKNLLFVGTGALLSATSTLQGETIPGIAHCVSLEVDR